MRTLTLGGDGPDGAVAQLERCVALAPDFRPGIAALAVATERMWFVPGNLADKNRGEAAEAAVARALAEALRTELEGRTIRMLIGILGDKQASAMLEVLGPLVSEIVTTAPESPRALPAEALASIAKSHHAEVRVAPSLEEGLDRLLARSAEDDVVLVCGSLYLVGEVRALLAGSRAGGPRESLVRAT